MLKLQKKIIRFYLIEDIYYRWQMVWWLWHIGKYVIAFEKIGINRQCTNQNGANCDYWIMFMFWMKREMRRLRALLRYQCSMTLRRRSVLKIFGKHIREKSIRQWQSRNMQCWSCRAFLKICLLHRQKRMRKKNQIRIRDI